jgi:hypothetical protein
MPYTSPLGITTTKPPPKKLPQSKASQARSAASSPRLTPSSNSTVSSSKNSYFSTISSDNDGMREDNALKPHVPSKELGEVSSRDRDAGVVSGLQHWKGWSARRESEDEDEGVDPLDEAASDKSGEQDVKAVVSEVGVDISS